MIEGFLTKSWMGLEVGTEVCLDEERQVLNVPNAPHPSFNKSLQGCTMVLIPGDYENLKEIIKTVYFIRRQIWKINRYRFYMGKQIKFKKSFMQM